jgi:hypothetical protein
MDAEGEEKMKLLCGNSSGTVTFLPSPVNRVCPGIQASQIQASAQQQRDNFIK